MKLNVHLKFDEESHERARIFIHLKWEEPRCFGKECDVENGGVGITY
jgi:hypothetical protein